MDADQGEVAFAKSGRDIGSTFTASGEKGGQVVA